MMNCASTSPPPPGKRARKQNHPRFGLRGSTGASKARALDRARRLTSRPVVQAENGGLGDLAMPKVRVPVDDEHRFRLIVNICSS